MFNLQRFNEEISADFNIFPEEYERYTITLVVSWISDGYIRTIFQSKNSQSPSLWGYKTSQKIETPHAGLSEKEMADSLYFTHIAGDFPAFFNTSNGVNIDWRNVPEELEPETLAEIKELLGRLESQSKACSVNI
ncbi:hypothetical protein [Corynebacterium auriscanis]|uniref:hypothetical protein n=1 Tax=Corynebacterium auriscanis TaxID=99807 RepID=UPI003CEBC1C5